MFMLYVIFRVLIFAGRPLPADARPIPRGNGGAIPVAAHLGGDVTFHIFGAVNSQCTTYGGTLVVECHNGTTMERIGPEFQDRISGSCNAIKIVGVKDGDFLHRFICQNLDHLKPQSQNYYLEATTAPPQNIFLSVNESNLRNKATVAETSTMLEGLLKSVDGDASGSSQNDTQPVEEGKWSSPLVLSLVSVVVSLVSLVSLVVLVWCLRKRCRNSVSGPKPKAEQTENGYSLVHITQSHPPHDVENGQM